ncbi:MAG: hypothetical protein M1834_009696 [Cirrosporium novae-zelandiae]|nr:MAG: hypothetical protein M1834_009696 [Cirrosporium novae-zelandiae]
MAAEYLSAQGISVPFLPSERPSASSGRPRLQKIVCVHLPNKSPDSLWDVHFSGSHVTSITPHDPSLLQRLSHLPSVLDGSHRLLAPSLCHAHIHLDKCFLLNNPRYPDLSIEKGDLVEAVTVTREAKKKFEHDDLMTRGRWAIQESLEKGVTAMRAFVEVDTIVEMKCLDAALALKEEFKECCEIQICAFAHEVVFTGDAGEANRRLMEKAMEREGVDVLGSTPYAEGNDESMRMNIMWAIDIAIQKRKHLDFHLDYNLKIDKEAQVWEVVRSLNEEWTNENPGKTVVLGHCTRLTLFNDKDWERLKQEVGDLPLSFVGLPASDMYMVGRPGERGIKSTRPRGTLQIPWMIKEHGFQAVLGVDNVGNGFTPQGTCDPLGVASLGVGLYHAGTQGDTEILYECVSSRAKKAIGVEAVDLQGLKEDSQNDATNTGRADFILFDREGDSSLDDRRRRKTMQEIVYDPPTERLVISDGFVMGQ